MDFSRPFVYLAPVFLHSLEPCASNGAEPADPAAPGQRQGQRLRDLGPSLCGSRQRPVNFFSYRGLISSTGTTRVTWIAWITILRNIDTPPLKTKTIILRGMNSLEKPPFLCAPCSFAGNVVCLQKWGPDLFLVSLRDSQSSKGAPKMTSFELGRII